MKELKWTSFLCPQDYPGKNTGVGWHFLPQPYVCESESESCSLSNSATPWNAEFQRRARRDKKAFLSDQCKEIEEKNRMGKTRDLFKKLRDTKGIFLAKMGTAKDKMV